MTRLATSLNVVHEVSFGYSAPMSVQYLINFHGKSPFKCLEAARKRHAPRVAQRESERRASADAAADEGDRIFHRVDRRHGHRVDGRALGRVRGCEELVPLLLRLRFRSC